MRKPGHLTAGLLVGALDGELSGLQAEEVEAHLAECDLCRNEIDSLRTVSMGLESLVASVPVASTAGARRRLETRLGEVVETSVPVQSPARVMRRFGWGMAIAATLAFGIVLAPKREVKLISPVSSSSEGGVAVRPNIEVDGETFTPLPYSNPEVAASAPHIVQMQVPISSLSDVGIVLEPVMNRVSAPDGSVLADVLIGGDGQPMGVHVLSLE